MNGKSRIKQFSTNRKRRIVLHWMSSFAITVVAVVATISLSTRTPIGTFYQVEPYGNEIFYHVAVEDPDSTIISGTLYLSITNQLERIRIPLVIGEQSGSVVSLNGGMDYTLSILCNYGYGEGVLATRTIQTDSRYGGRITGWDEYIPDSGEINLAVFEETNQIAIHMLYSDPTNELSEVWLSYVYYQKGEYPEENHPLPNAVYTNYLLSASKEDCIVDQLWDGSIRFYTYLWGRTLAGEDVLLHSLSFTTPRKIFASLDPIDIGSDYLILDFYADFIDDPAMTFTISLIQDSRMLETKTIGVQDCEEEESYTQVEFDGLTSGGVYQVQLTAHYLEMGKMIDQPLRVLDIPLPKPYELNLNHTSNVLFMQFDVELDDPNHVLSELYYYVFEVVDDQNNYVSGDYITLTESASHHYDGSFQVDWDMTKTYQLMIFGTKTAPDGTTYPWMKIIHLDY